MVNPKLEETIAKVQEKFFKQFKPLEKQLVLIVDNRTGAHYCECHVRADEIITFGTIDAPLDPEDQAEYRANRDIVEDHVAFDRMKEDALARRSFSNIVTEYMPEHTSSKPLLIIGGQHRFQAIKEALSQDINEWHGLKVYLALSTDQRLDVALISNTNIATSGHLFDRMHETVKGPEFREWCQSVGFLDPNQDFASTRRRGSPFTVQAARSFITNYYLGKSINVREFENSDTTPVLSITGQYDADWEKLRSQHAKMFLDAELKRAAQEFSKLNRAQRQAYKDKKPKVPPDYPEKAINMAVLASWAYVAGILAGNDARLGRHFSLAKTASRDPLNAAELAKGRHKSDPENYRGLGYRTDAKERARLVELFFLQAEGGDGITKQAVDIAIKKYHAKQAQLEVLKAQAKASE